MLGERIKLLRQEIKWTQSQMADAVGVSKRTIIDWEKGVSSPNAVQLSALAAAGIDVTYIITGVRMDERMRHNIALMLNVTRGQEPAGTGSLTTKALEALSQVAESSAVYGVEENNRRIELQQLIARCGKEELDMIEPLLRRLVRK